MRIQQIRIDQWRHFEDVQIDLPDTAPMVCLVGGNGTGKSQILELIASCATRIGLSAGTELQRGDPFSEDARFAIRFFISSGSLPDIETEELYPEHLRNLRPQWDRTLIVEASGMHTNTVKAGGIEQGYDRQFAQAVIGIIQRSQSVHYLSLDADRSYPKIQIAGHQLGEIFDRDWGEQTNKQSSFRITRNLYEEWFRFLIGRENRANSKFIQNIRLARERGESDPVFEDQFKDYKDSLRQVLPHLLFIGVDPADRQIKFDSTGIELTFDRLSGGEREIAFLVGQIERFGLKKGLLLVDEPELHLNYDLLRSWIGYLKQSVEDGQIWLASHALEVVEATGQESTILLERDAETRKVTKAGVVADQPVVATLSRAVGSPAFSISSLAFVFIEGEEEIGERERFRLLCGNPVGVRFMEGGSCKEVLRKIAVLQGLAQTSNQPLRTGAIIDGDWRSSSERAELVNAGAFVLGTHEVENFYLHPPTLTAILQTIGSSSNVDDLLRASADRRAGSWIFDAARTQHHFKEYPAPSRDVRELVHRLGWSDFADIDDTCERIAAAHGQLDEGQVSLLRRHLTVHAKIYERKRTEPELWKVCEGKEVFHSLVRDLGFADADAAERAIVALWTRMPEVIPDELVALRDYVSSR